VTQRVLLGPFAYALRENGLDGETPSSFLQLP
jgi:hypothetical protein